jgi:hypothetical protein
MRAPELTILIGAAIAVVLIIVADVRRRSGRLSSNMLFVLRIILGVVFAILGVIGSVLPIMQGWVFFLLAALVLFPQSRFAIKALAKIEPRMPRLVRWLRSMGIGTERTPRDTMPVE